MDGAGNVPDVVGPDDPVVYPPQPSVPDEATPLAPSLDFQDCDQPALMPSIVVGPDGDYAATETGAGDQHTSSVNRKCSGTRAYTPETGAVVVGPDGEHAACSLTDAVATDRGPLFQERFPGAEARRRALASWLPIEHDDPIGASVWQAKEVPAVPPTLVAVISLHEPDHTSVQEAIEWRVQVHDFVERFRNHQVGCIFVNPADGAPVWCACCCSAPAIMAPDYKSETLDHEAVVAAVELGDSSAGPVSKRQRAKGRARVPTETDIEIDALRQEIRTESVKAVAKAHIAMRVSEQLWVSAIKLRDDLGRHARPTEAAWKRAQDAEECSMEYIKVARGHLARLRCTNALTHARLPQRPATAAAKGKRGECGCTMDRPNTALAVASRRGPRVYMTVGGQVAQFPGLLWYLPGRDCNRWIHRPHPKGTQPYNVYFCFMSATDPLPEHSQVRAAAAMAATAAAVPECDEKALRFTCANPLVSVFVSAFRSGDKILRLYESMLGQTYNNWELVVVDDSGDGEATYRDWLVARMPDSRVRRIRMDDRCGYIGSVKRLAASACVGEILVEADHDDRLMPTCIEHIVAAFEANWDCGFAYAETAESFAVDGSAHWYETYKFASGLGLQWRQWVPMLNCWLVGSRTVNLNRGSLRHLMYMPNHPRAWTADCYKLAGGHRVELSVSDDFDLLLRTALVTRWVRINEVAYIQYRNDGGNNQTVLRNKQIQTLCAMLADYYSDRLVKRMNALKAPILPEIDVPLWETALDNPWRTGMEAVYRPAGSENQTAYIYAISSIDTHAAASARAHLAVRLRAHMAQPSLWHENPIAAVGNDLPEALLIEAARTIPSTASAGSLRWWPLKEDAGRCAEYGRLLMTHLDSFRIVDGHDDDDRGYRDDGGGSRYTAATIIRNEWGTVVGPS